MRYCVLTVHLMQAILIIVGMSLCLEVDGVGIAVQNGTSECNETLPIVRVFNTTQRLWLYWKNYTDNMTEMEESQESNCTDCTTTQKCTFIKKYNRYNISDEDFLFWWTTMIMDDMVRMPCYGKFSSEGGGGLGSMDAWVFSNGRLVPLQKMTLMYTEKNCSVFFLWYPWNNTDADCELYVRNKAIPQGPSLNCSKYYDEHCKNRTLASSVRRIRMLQFTMGKHGQVA
ncbi:uncharacterized protein LOC119402892 [Rhipicephalus sanguineus]|uniref:uncharacterized protein LOC119402892 n=1 Tax=Rhipicephalus sanguineus TaxID=34632 RepID=UPI0020C1BFD7|nr:uncharacterized protein LOC119402892 [Rhipicephalus sanguineus]